MAITVAMRTEISQLYVSLFGRAPDGEGLGFWVNSYDKGNTLASIAQSMYDTAPARAYYPLFATPSEIVTTFYTNVLGRAPDAEGLAFWVKEYGASATQGAFFSKLISNVVNYNGTDAAGVTSKSLFANKVAVAQYYGEQNGTVAGATAALNGVTAVAASVDTAKAAIVNTVVSGQTFTLTTGIDGASIKGDAGTTSTAGNDTFSGSITFAVTGGEGTPTAASTFNLADSISGGLGIDTLNLVVDGGLDGAAVPPVTAASISGIEIVNLRNVGAEVAATDNLTLNADNYPGITAIHSDRSSSGSTLSVTNLATGATIGMKGNGVVSNGDVVFAYKTATTPINIAISDGTKSAVTATATLAAQITNTASGATTATIKSTGAANTVDLITLSGNASITAITIDATTDLTLGGAVAGNAQVGIVNSALSSATLTVTGAGVVDIETMGAALTTVNASANTGGLKTVMSATATAKVTGSATANNTVTTGSVLTTGFAAAGAGTGDRLILADATHLTSVTASKYTGFEVLRNDGATDFDVTVLAGATSLEVGGANAGLTGMTAAQAASIRVLASNGTNTFALGNALGTSDVIGFTLQNETAAAVATAIDLTALTITGIETLNVISSAGVKASTSGTGNDLGFAAAANLTAINVSGEYDLTITNTNISKAVTITSTQTGTAKLFTTGALAIGSKVQGSGGADSFTITTNEGSTFLGGAGNDTFVIVQSVLLADGTTDTVINGEAGTADVLNVTDAAANLNDAHFTNVTGMESLTLVGTTSIALTTGGSFKSGFVDGVTVTAGAAIVGASSLNFGLYDKPVNLLLDADAAGAGATEADVLSVTGGSAADTLTVLTIFEGHATTDQSIAINGGAGNDIISLTVAATLLANASATSLQKITGGLGADNITVSTHINHADATTGITFSFAGGDSTVTAFDSVTGYRLGDLTGAISKAADTLDFATANLLAYNATTATGYASSELTVAVSATGVVTFAGTSAASLSVAQKLAAVQSVVVTATGNTAMFVDGADTYVFNNLTAGDSVVRLVGVAAEALVAVFNVTTDNHIFIA